MVQYPSDENAEPPANRDADSVDKQGKRVPAIFFRTEAGGEPVREGLRSLSPGDRKRIGEDIKSVEYGWPIGMPVCRPLGNGIFEVRTAVSQGRIARVFSTSTREAGWFCCTVSSRRLRKRRMMT